MKPARVLLVCALASAAPANAILMAVTLVSKAIKIAKPSRPTSALVEDLKSPSAASRASAAWALAGAGTIKGEAAQLLVAALDDPSEPVQEAATWALAHVKAEGFDASQVFDTPPKAVYQAKPAYPQDEFIKGVQGEVVVEFLVDASGNLKHVELRKSIPNFDEASLACVRTFRFKPALRKGRPVPATLSVPITFRIFEERRPRR